MNHTIVKKILEIAKGPLDHEAALNAILELIDPDLITEDRFVLIECDSQKDARVLVEMFQSYVQQELTAAHNAEKAEDPLSPSSYPSMCLYEKDHNYIKCIYT